MSRNPFISTVGRWALGAILTMVSGCHPYLGYEDSHYDLSIPQPIHVFVGNPSAGVDVRSGMGTVDRLAQMNEKTVRVFAINTREGVRYDREGGTWAAPDFLLNGAVGTLSGSQVNWDSASPYYYPNNEDYYHTYDFTACFLDDLAPLSIQRTADDVRYELRIDGWQDLMTSRAQAPEGYSFSYLAARTDVNPIFKMQHQMVKLRFQLKPGVTAGIAKPLKLSEFELDTPTRGYLTVASRRGELTADFSSGTPQPMPLIVGKGGGRYVYFVEQFIETLPDGSQATSDKTVKLGGDDAYLLVPPAQAYDCKFYVNDLSTSLEATDKVKSLLAFSSGEPFKAGNAYVVTFELFGRNQVRVYVDMEEWDKYAGQSLDFDNDW